MTTIITIIIIAHLRSVGIVHLVGIPDTTTLRRFAI